MFYMFSPLLADSSAENEQSEKRPQGLPEKLWPSGNFTKKWTNGFN